MLEVRALDADGSRQDDKAGALGLAIQWGLF